MAVPRARLACPVRSFGWGRRTWASKVLPREGLRPQMHRGAGAHCVTARPVLVERNTAAPPLEGGEGWGEQAAAGDACLQASGAPSTAPGASGRREGGGVSDCVCKEQAVCGMRASRSPGLSPAPSGTPSAGRRRHAHPFCAPPGAPFCRERWCSYNKSIRLEASGDYPPNLSISLSGGKEINRDLLSSGERTGASPALNRGSAHAGREMWGEGLPAHPRGRGRAPHVEASARRPRTPHQRG